MFVFILLAEINSACVSHYLLIENSSSLWVQLVGYNGYIIYIHIITTMLVHLLHDNIVFVYNENDKRVNW